MTESKWQPIETHPKDDNIFIACDVKGSRIALIAYNYLSEKYEFFTGKEIEDQSWMPTHWMLFPEPPED